MLLNSTSSKTVDFTVFMNTNDRELSLLSSIVQKNCHIADARYASDYSLCVYLLKMREYYRWEHKHAFTDTLDNQRVGEWLSQREQLWDEVSESDYEPITIDCETLDPFETDIINERLLDKGLIYSGGLGNHCRPLFFLGRLQHQHQENGYRILVSSTEYARDLTAPPAMALGNTVFIRRESLRRMLWEKLEEWRWNRNEGAMMRALQCYAFDEDLNKSLEQMTDNETQTVLLHEIGEIRAGELLGDEWNEMLAALPRSRTELMARAIRDHLADCISTLPALLEQENHASLHFYFGNFRAMRQHLFPSLLDDYQHWINSGELDRLHDRATEGNRHWLALAQELLELYRQYGVDQSGRMERLMEQNIL